MKWNAKDIKQRIHEFLLIMILFALVFGIAVGLVFAVHGSGIVWFQ